MLVAKESFARASDHGHTPSSSDNPCFPLLCDNALAKAASASVTSMIAANLCLKSARKAPTIGASFVMEQKVKVVMLGSSHVGKTSIVTQYLNHTFDTMTAPTIGASFVNKVVKVNEEVAVRLQIWDTAGQERFRSLTPMYYQDAQAAVVVFALDNLASFNAIPSWVEGLTDYNESRPALFLVANKADLACNVIGGDSIDKMANDYGATVLFTSAKTGVGIDELFWEVAQRCAASKRQGMEEIDVSGNKHRGSCGC